MKTVRTLVTAAAVAIAAVLLTAAPAAAHAQLVSSDPEDGAVLDEAPETAVLEFSESIDAPSTQIALTDSTGAVIPTRPFVVEGMRVTIPLDLPAGGIYTIGYRIVSEDGHRVDGSISFRSETASEGASASPAPVSSDSAPAPTNQATGTDEASNPAIYWILGAIAAAAVVAVIVVVARRKPTARP
ncbi:copper resistance CopC family protein [Phytomonospora sp. NPDC050363]|uniref:copper resistance CopC family protein n=1 Tax=Phytomonospora sp. NPDC050363 TaxID=3155642 RepID=UPI0033EA413E